MDAGTALQMPQNDAPMIRQQEQQTLAPMYAELDQMQKQRSSVQPPTLKGTQPEPQQGQPGLEWIAAIHALAALGGARARDGATTALKAFSGGMQGLQKANIQQFTQAHDDWKEANKATLDLNKEQLAEYKTVMDAQNKSISEKKAEISSIAMQYQNQIMGSARDYATQMRLFDMQQKQLDKANAEAKKISDTGQKIEDLVQQGVIAQKGKAIINGASYTDVGISMRSSNNPERDAVDEWIAQNNPDFDRAQAITGQAGRRSGATAVGRQAGAAQLASNIIDQSLPSMIASAQKLGLSPNTSLNAVVNAARRQFSDKDYTNFSTQLRAVATDYSQLIGRGRPTVHSDEEALKILNPNMGLDALQGFAEAARTEGANVQRGVGMTTGQGGGNSGGGQGAGASDPLGIR